MNSSSQGSKYHLGDVLIFDEMLGLRPITATDLENKILKWFVVGPNGKLIPGDKPPVWDTSISVRR